MDRLPSRLEEVFTQLAETMQERMTVCELLTRLTGKEYPLLLFLMSLPFGQPFHIPGFSTIFGLIIACIGMRMGCGRSLWIPKAIFYMQLPGNVIRSCAQSGLWVITKTKRFVFPRALWICRQRILSGIVIAVLGLFLALPIPFTHMVAAWPITCISFGIASDDGAVVMIGYVLAFLCVLFFVTTFKAVERFAL